jgi:hypothetical protein
MGTDPHAAVLGVYTGEMNVALIRPGRGEKSHQEGDKDRFLFHNKGGVAEVVEEESGQHPGQVPPTPPPFENGDDAGVIGGLAVP